MNLENLNNYKNIHFIGIGGAGMYPLAVILRKMGFNVSGSDNYLSDTLQDAIKVGLKVFTEHKAENVKNADAVVFSAAIKEDNPELKFARLKGIPVLERAELLGLIMNQYKDLVAVSGTHGKTTTSALLTHVFLKSGLDPTAVIGGKLPEINGNSCFGISSYAVCEACEYVDTFLNLNPAVSVILNIDNDHLDYFKSINRLVDSFRKFANKAKKIVVINFENKNTNSILEEISLPILGFGLNEKLIDKDAKNKFLYIYSAIDIYENKGFYSFTVLKNKTKFLKISLSIPGRHNIYNALAVIAVSDYFKIPGEKIKVGVESFTGVHRRLEILAKVNDITVMDDFAHHPTEIKATLDTVSKMGFKRIISIFQPHTYSRTNALLDEFAKVLSKADVSIVSEILAVREKNIYNVHSKDLVNLIKNGIYLKTFDDITKYVKKIAKPGDLILTMSGGNVYKCANDIASELRKMYSN